MRRTKPPEKTPTGRRRRWSFAALVLLLTMPLASPARALTEMAVTIDDLPTHGPLPPGTTRLEIVTRMIHALKRNVSVPVYGFANGGQIADSPELEGIIRAWLQAGFLLGNHTFSHLDLSRVSAVEYIADIERNEALLSRWSPTGVPRYFRHPYLHEGNTATKRIAVRQWLAGQRYTVAPVTVSFDDWVWNEAYARCVAVDDRPAIAHLKRVYMAEALSRLSAFQELSVRLFGRPIRHILLMHMGAFDAAMLDELLTAYHAVETKFISLDDALRDSVFMIDPGLVQEGGQTFLVQVAKARQVPIPDALSRSPQISPGVCR
jgi:peptidoglycan-N-acetylglucosamine deacetylase